MTRQSAIRPATRHYHLIPHIAALQAAALLVWGSVGPAKAVTKTVCSSGCDYTTISAAVSGAPLGPGVTIQVSGGPYLEKVVIGNRDGTSGSRAVIQAVGTVIIDGSDSYANTALWTQYNGDSTYYASNSTISPPDWLILVDN